jgi:hypothetical protein
MLAQLPTHESIQLLATQHCAYQGITQTFSLGSRSSSTRCSSMQEPCALWLTSCAVALQVWVGVLGRDQPDVEPNVW